MSDEASRRASEAWEQRFKHVRAANAWLECIDRQPERAEVCRVLADWMTAYADADAEAERRFSELAAREGATDVR